MPVFSERDKEKIHWTLYDAVPAVPTEEDSETDDGGFRLLLGSGNLLSFFQDIQRKTRLETNMEASGMLSRNSYEIRAMRVVLAPLPEADEDGVGGAGNDGNGNGGGGDPGDEGSLGARPVEEFIYNSVTRLRVGEKLYIEAPTFMFPAGSGPSTGNGGAAVNHGEPNPMATWRFAEPIVIPPQQSFRVEISFPRGIQSLTNLSGARMRVWVLLDGYLTRDVQ